MFARTLMAEPTPLPMPNSQSESMMESVSPFQNSAFGPSAQDVAKRHAEMLLLSLIDDLRGCLEREFSAQEMMTAYGEVCAENVIAVRPWNGVANQLAKLLRKRGRPAKTYKRYVDKNGKDRRRRVYVIPNAMPS
jgi:hypothetical protein